MISRPLASLEAELASMLLVRADEELDPTHLPKEKCMLIRLAPNE